MTPINYDKYKGHTKGPFEVQEDYNKFFLVRRRIDKKKGFEVLEVGQNEATAHLFADSPLILQRCMELEEEKAILIEALRSIQNPIEYLQNEAEKDGCKLNGSMALQLIGSPDFFQTIARQALSRAEE